MKRANYEGFYEALQKTIKQHKEYKEIIKYCPSFFELLCKIVNDRETDWNVKLIIDAALSYFVIPNDIIPDRDERGYVDDMFITCHVLKYVKEISKNLILRNWDGDDDILRLIDKIYSESKTIVVNEEFDILQKVGLHKFQSLELGEYSGTYHEKLAKLGNEKRELLGLLAFVVKQIYGLKTKTWKTEQFIEFLKEFHDIDEINRIIEISKKNHKYEKKSNIEESGLGEKLREARRKVLLEG